MNFTTEEFDKNKRPFCFEDHFVLIDLSSVKLSPDGNQVLCVITKTLLTHNCRNDSIVLIDISNKEPMLLTEGSFPCWSPSGSSFAYISDKDGKNGIWIYDFKDNSKRFLAPLYHSDYFINHLEEKKFCWSPDGNNIAYVSSPPFSESDNKNSNIKVINRLLYKTKGGRGRSHFTDDYLTHIWIVPSAGGDSRQITEGNYNEHSITWSPDNLQIAFISNRSADPDNNQYCDLWKVDIKTKVVTRLTDDLGTAFQPKWSPDGNYLAYLATTSVISTNDSQSDDTHLYLIPLNGGLPHCLTTQLDRRIENIHWHSNSDLIYFTAGNHGMTPLYKVSVKSGDIEIVTGGKCHIMEYSISADGKSVALLKTDISNPPEIFLIRASQQEIIQITNQNKSLVSKCTLQDAEEFWFKSFDGTSVQGWIMKPAIFDYVKTYSLILVIHGGPHNMFGYDFEERMQILSAQGYAVLFINPRGSSGYGQQFSKGNVLNWGGGDYKDLMTGVDYIIDKYKWIDKERLGVTGQSYGGYMTNWIITQTKRFKAAVVDGGISNLISFSGTSLYHSLMESEFNGNVYENFALLWQWSPLRCVKNVTTPTLFLHGESDNEVPVSQAEEMYVALKKLGVSTYFVQYIGEGHGWRPDLKPKNRYDLYQRMINWFDLHLNAV